MYGSRGATYVSVGYANNHDYGPTDMVTLGWSIGHRTFLHGKDCQLACDACKAVVYPGGTLLN